MSWLDFFKKRDASLSGDDLRDRLFDAVRAGDEKLLDSTCRVHRARILAEFKTWLKMPESLRGDAKAVARHGEGLMAVAGWFARNGEPQLQEELGGKGRENPIRRWEVQFGKADEFKSRGRFAEAIEVLSAIAEEMGKSTGSAVEKVLPMVHGSMGECFFRSGDLDQAFQLTQEALDGCERSGDVAGLINYCENMAVICAAREEPDEARYWMTASTNMMIQTGQRERAAALRREHGIEPVTGLIDIERPK